MNSTILGIFFIIVITIQTILLTLQFRTTVWIFASFLEEFFSFPIMASCFRSSITATVALMVVSYHLPSFYMRNPIQSFFPFASLNIHASCCLTTHFILSIVKSLFCLILFWKTHQNKNKNVAHTKQTKSYVPNSQACLPHAFVCSFLKMIFKTRLNNENIKKVLSIVIQTSKKCK